MTQRTGETVNMWMKITRLLQPEAWDENFGRSCAAHATAGRRWLAQTLDDWLTDAPAEDVPGFDEYSPQEPLSAEEWLRETFEEGYIDNLNQNFYKTEVMQNVQ